MNGIGERHFHILASPSLPHLYIFQISQPYNRPPSAEDQTPIASSPLIGPEPTSITTASIIRSGHLPHPQLGVIGEIERAIKTLARTQAVKERICEYIQQEVSNLCPLFFLTYLYFHHVPHVSLSPCLYCRSGCRSD